MTSTQQQTNSETLEQQVQHLNPGGPDQRIKSEVRPTGVQLKRCAKLLTVIGLTIKQASKSQHQTLKAKIR